MPKITDDAMVHIDAAQARDIIPAICKQAGSLVECNVSVLRNIGLGSGAGLRLLDCTTATEMAVTRNDLGREFLKLDIVRLKKHAVGTDKAERVKSALLFVVGRLALLVDGLRVSSVPTKLSDGEDKATYILAQNEEEHSFSMRSWSQPQMNLQLELLITIYNLRLRTHELGSLSNGRAMAFWVKNMMSSPDPVRFPLAKYRRDPTDSPFLLLRRAFNDLRTIACGEINPDRLRDDGAGKVAKFGVQWASSMQFGELLAEVDEYNDLLTAKQMMVMCKLIYKMMFAMTSRGGMSASLAASQLIGKVCDYASRHQADDGQLDDGRRTGGRVRTKKGKPAVKPPISKGNRAAKVARKAAVSAAEAETGGDDGYKGEWEDKAGVLGPSGMARKKGGNPAAPVCNRFKAGRCSFNTCSFSHEAK